MDGESGVTRSIIDQLHSSDIQEDQNEGESGVNRSIIDDLYFWDIQRSQIECESGVIRSIIDQLHSTDMVKWTAKVVLIVVSLLNFIRMISKEIKMKVKMV